MKSVIFLVSALLFLLVTGCVQSVRYTQDEIKDFPPSIQEQIKKGEVSPGMTQLQVRYSWGAPDSVILLAPTAEGKNREEWVYTRLGGVFKTRLIFTDGKITEIISTEPGVIK